MINKSSFVGGLRVIFTVIHSALTDFVFLVIVINKDLKSNKKIIKHDKV